MTFSSVTTGAVAVPQCFDTVLLGVRKSIRPVKIE